MSDSVDRVFVHALATVRRLPRTGSSRPPPTSRLRLYGLYKQSMEGDVLAILPRPTLPVSSPDLTNNITTTTNHNNNSVHRYASRDVRTREAQAEIEKWDAWHACAGMSRTDAKREYISTLIETMKEYASGTAESRELVNELEFVWSQIRSQSGSGSDPDADVDLEQDGQSRSPEGRKSDRSRPSLGSGELGARRSESGDVNRSRSIGARQQGQEPGQGRKQKSHRQEQPRKPTRTLSGLRVLPPVSQEDSNSLSSRMSADADVDADADADNEETHHNNLNDDDGNLPSQITLPSLQKTLESHITHLRTELAALREQLSTNNLLSASTYTLGHHYYSLTPTQRFLHRLKLFLRTYSLVLVRQVFVQVGVLGVLVLWGRVTGDKDRWVEGWVGRVWRRWKGALGWWGWWVLESLGRGVGWVGWVFRRGRRGKGM